MNEVGYVHSEVPGPVPLHVSATEVPLPPSVRCAPGAHCTVQVAPMEPDPQSLVVNGAASGAQLAGTHVDVLPK